VRKQTIYIAPKSTNETGRIPSPKPVWGRLGLGLGSVAQTSGDLPNSLASHHTCYPLNYRYIFLFARSQYWKYSTGQNNGVDAFGYNSAESEPIWMKSGTV